MQEGSAVCDGTVRMDRTVTELAMSVTDNPAAVKSVVSPKIRGCTCCGQEISTDSTLEWCQCMVCKQVVCRLCLVRLLGEAEYRRIAISAKGMWRCGPCTDATIKALPHKQEWREVSYQPTLKQKKLRKRKRRVVCDDISKGREEFPIPCINEFDDSLPIPFTYIVAPAPGNDGALKNNANFKTCCSCVDNCRDASKCECAIAMGGRAYNSNGILVADKPGGVYECNYLCACNRHRCVNRVVSRGPRFPLEVFRCGDEQQDKGWGVRSTVDIPPGSFVADYIGEILEEKECENRGVRYGDEYLFTLDSWGRATGNQRLEDLGISREQQRWRHTHSVQLTLATSPSKPNGSAKPDELCRREKLPIDPLLCEVASMSRSEIRELLGSKLFDTICRSSSVLKRNGRLVLCGGRGTDVEGKGSLEPYLPTSPHFRRRWMQMWSDARAVVTDRVLSETEGRHDTFAIDAKWCGNVGRFLNHSCDPNLEKVNVFVDSHDARVPRVAFFANSLIKAGTELCYDYGYFTGYVEGKHRTCLCGAANCRKEMY